MFHRTNKAEPAPAAATINKKGSPSVISSELNILGNLLSDGVIDIDGSLEGNVKAEQVTVRPNGKISGDIVAHSVHIYGTVRGMVRAHSVHLYSSCHVEGVIIHHTMSVEDGSFIDAKFKRVSDSPSSENSLGDTIDNNEFAEPFLSGNLRLIS